MESLQIGQVSQRTGLSVDAIRFYEKAGLLPRPARTQVGFSLNEIRELFSIQRHPQEACVHVRDLIAQKLTVVRTKIEELRTLEAGLSDALKQCRRALRHPAQHQESCPVLQEITTAR